MSLHAQFLPQDLLPSQIWVEYEGGGHLFTKIGTQMTHKDIALELLFHQNPEGVPSLKLLATAEKKALKAIRCQWKHPMASHLLFLGDEWCEGEGGFQWRTMDPCRLFPWYVLLKGNEETVALGVAAQGGAFASWNVTPRGISLHLDVRNASGGVDLSGRVLEVATLFFCRYERPPMAAARRFCALLSPEPIFANLPVYGIISRPQEEDGLQEKLLLEECDTLALACNSLTNRPFQILSLPWESLEEDGVRRFAEAAGRRGVRPGLTRRLLWDPQGRLPQEWHQKAFPQCLDPTLPEVQEEIQRQVRQSADWGYELLRHISATTDALHGVFQTPTCTPMTWQFARRDKTNAEVIVDLCRAIRHSMGDMILYGEDLPSSLVAGLLHLCRISRDLQEDSPFAGSLNLHRRINALAFRLCQNTTFYTLDPGPLEFSPRQGWNEWQNAAHLYAHSSTAFFVSLHQDCPLSAKAFRELSQCFAGASMGNAQAIPADWLENTFPEQWIVNGTPLPLRWQDWPLPR